MARITIDGEDLVQALQMNVDEGRFFLNTETGAIVLEFDGAFDGEDMDLDDIEEAIENGPYLAIDPVTSRDAYGVMEDFIETLPEGRLRKQLEDAIAGKGAFRRFKDRLYDEPAIQEKYYSFEEEAYRRFALDWLEANDIDAEMTFPVRKSE